jgi:DNA-binding transcriptional LysR family regulator
MALIVSSGDSGTVALPLLKDSRRVVCAVPAQLARHDVPASPRYLAAHNCLCFMVDETVNNRCRFRTGDETVEVTVRGDRVADDSEIVRRWALDGLGLCYRSRIDVQADLARGALRTVCADLEGNTQPLYMVLANRRRVSPAGRTLREFLVEKMKAMLA